MRDGRYLAGCVIGVYKQQTTHASCAVAFQKYVYKKKHCFVKSLVSNVFTEDCMSVSIQMFIYRSARNLCEHKVMRFGKISALFRY